MGQTGFTKAVRVKVYGSKDCMATTGQPDELRTEMEVRGMLKEVDLHAELTDEEKPEVKAEVKALGDKMGVLQQKLKQAGIPVVIVFEGWGASGKGSQIGQLLLNLDPRGVMMYSTVDPSEEEKRKPFMNRFWMEIPKRGEIAIFDRSWYHEWIAKGDQGHLREISTFERQLTDDGYELIKIFLHISKKEQARRLKNLEEDKTTAWRVKKADWKQNEKYEAFSERYEIVLSETNYENSPWNVISGMNRKETQRDILRLIVERMEARLAEAEILTAEKTAVKKKGRPAKKKVCVKGIMPEEMEFPMVPMPKISEVDLNCAISEEEYEQRLDKLQKKLMKLSYKLYKKHIPLIIGYEGWDAAGKGGNIKRLVSCFDPRDYVVKPIAAPDAYEKSRQFLWRFRKYLPKTGHIAVFDRTWYGRVMVERVEGFCTENDWKRAYNEINEFERELYDWGAIVVKFWLQIDKDEQLARFNDRQNTPEKQWKITEEDWRNREKWEAYEVALDDMLQYTSTEFAPWHIIESNNKQYARIKAIETVIDAIEQRLKRK